MAVLIQENPLQQERRQTPIQIAVVGHTNAGKTSLLRTLTRQVHFGEIASAPGTTRHVQAAELKLRDRCAVRFLDTPGLEDSVALWDYLRRMDNGLSAPQRVQAFFGGPEAKGVFEQEAKVLRALLQCEAAFLVIDTREDVLPKYRCEVEILCMCARPIVPVLNFVRSPDSRVVMWSETMAGSNLHYQVQFDAVAPFMGSELQIYRDLEPVLRDRRAQLQAIVQALVEQARQRQWASWHSVAALLVEIAAMRKTITPQVMADEQARQACVTQFRAEVLCRVRKGVEDVMYINAFRADDADVALQHWRNDRWEDDLFNPEILQQTARKFGLGAVIGAAVGAVADVAMAGLSLGAAAALGATIGGLASQGWRPMAHKLRNKFKGVEELSVDDTVLLLLTDGLQSLCQALQERGHAATHKLQITTQPPNGPDNVQQALLQVVATLQRARAWPQWAEKNGRFHDGDAIRQELMETIARQLQQASPMAQTTD